MNCPAFFPPIIIAQVNFPRQPDAPIREKIDGTTYYNDEWLVRQAGTFTLANFSQMVNQVCCCCCWCCCC